jgi:hypothetical protein
MFFVISDGRGDAAIERRACFEAEALLGAR